MKKNSALATAVAAALAGFATLTPAHAHGPAPGAKLGQVHLEVSCNAAAQQEVDLAMAYYHSFAWDQYKAPLARALQADPGCGMAHWLRALGGLDNPFGWPVNLNPKILADGEAALGAARTAGLKTARERDYVEALSAFYRDHDKLAHPARAKALEAAFEQLAQRYPGDVEAQILHALFLSRNFDPQDKTYGNQLRAAKILEPIFMKRPEHPGAAHYLVHSYDYPPLAKQGLEAAKRYAKIAPDAAHALHMPSHIFTRVGMWKESVESNRASAESAKASGSSPNRLHAMDYMVYAYLQMGEDATASKVLTEAKAVEKYADNFAVAYGLAAMPARVALERGAWSEASQLALYPAADAFPWSKHPQAEAMNAYARGIGAGTMKNAAAARAEAERLRKLRDSARELKFGYWIDQIDIQAEAIDGLALLAGGQREQGVAALRQAAAREDATEKHVVTPGPLVPARELLARTLLDSGDSAGALKEFEAVLNREPNRYRAVLGAAMAAEKSGDRVRAAAHYARLVELAPGADPARTELASAKRFLGR